MNSWVHEPWSSRRDAFAAGGLELHFSEILAGYDALSQRKVPGTWEPQGPGAMQWDIWCFTRLPFKRITVDFSIVNQFSIFLLDFIGLRCFHFWNMPSLVVGGNTRRTGTSGTASCPRMNTEAGAPAEFLGESAPFDLERMSVSRIPEL